MTDASSKLRALIHIYVDREFASTASPRVAAAADKLAAAVEMLMVGAPPLPCENCASTVVRTVDVCCDCGVWQ